MRIIKCYLDEGLGQPKIAKEENIFDGMLVNWIKAYLIDGEDGLKSKATNRGNRFSAHHTSKFLSEEDRLKLTIAKQAIEIE